jgi:hypothetical protein
VEVSQQKTDQDEDARKSPKDHFHNIYLFIASLVPRPPGKGKTFPCLNGVDFTKQAALSASRGASPRVRALHQNQRGRRACIITSSVPQLRDYGTSSAAYAQYAIYWRLIDFCASGNLTLD